MTLPPSPNYLEIQPNSAVFFDYIPKRLLLSSIQLKNTTTKPVAFKIRTNAPFSYLVKPRLGIVQPNHSISLSITMQPTDLDPQTTAVNDKFLINAYSINDDIIRLKGNGSSCLKEVFEKTPQSQVQTHKLLVTLKAESSGTQEDSVDTKDGSGNENSPGRSSSQGNTSFRTSFSELFERQGSEGILEELSQRSTSEGVTPSNGHERLTRCHTANEISSTTLLDKFSMLERQGSEAVLGSKSSESKKKDLLMGIDEHRQLFAQVLQERDKLKEHLDSMKKNAQDNVKTKEANGGLRIKGDYQLWHLIAVAVIGLLLGALLKLK